MKPQWLAVAGAMLIFAAGCAAKKLEKPADANASIPMRCITEARATDRLVCVESAEPGWAICNGIAVRYSCIHYKPKP